MFNIGQGENVLTLLRDRVCSVFVALRATQTVDELWGLVRRRLATYLVDQVYRLGALAVVLAVDCVVDARDVDYSIFVTCQLQSFSADRIKS